MKIKILSLKGEEFAGEAVSFNVKTVNGEITVLDHHHPLITVLSKGSACVTRPNNDKIFLDINSGFLEMSRQNELKVLMDQKGMNADIEMYLADFDGLLKVQQTFNQYLNLIRSDKNEVAPNKIEHLTQSKIFCKVEEEKILEVEGEKKS